MGHTTTQLNTALIDQSTESQCRSLLRTTEAGLMAGEPFHLMFGDHTGGHRFQEEFSKGHR